MKFNKITYSAILVASAFIACSVVAAEFADNNEAKNTPVQEVSPFENVKINADDIQPAIIKEMQINQPVSETKKNATTSASETKKDTAKEDTTAVQKLKTDENVETKKADSDVKTEETPVQEVKKEELPKLEEIELPELTQKSGNNEPVKIEVSSQRIPQGTVLPLTLETTINSMTSSMGDQFNAILSSDVIINDKMVLPAGSVVRGTIGNMRKAGFCKREAKLMLIFDHIVTPVGKQVPIYAYMNYSNKVNYEGYIVGGTSYSKAFKEDASKSKDILVDTTKYGVDKGLSVLAGVPVVLTAPVCAIGGTLGAGGYITGKSIYNIFVHGAEVQLNPGTQLNITLSKALDIPVN